MSVNSEIGKLQKQVLKLERKLQRSEANRAVLENIRDNNSKLFTSLNIEIEKQREIVRDKNVQLEALANKLAKYLSPQLYNSIFQGERDVKIESYRITLTVFFCDFVGFTNQSEKMEVAEFAEWLNAYLNVMASTVLKHGGTLDKFIGDSIMVFYGDPKTEGVEKDALNCVSMAIEMRDIAAKMDVSTRIGINTGECIVGNFGSENRLDYTAIGRVVNIASRLETNSAPGRILISESTANLVKDKVACEAYRPIEVKGIEQKLMTYWVT